MKELSIEQKAKAYDEAIKRVENIRTGKCETTFMFTEGLLEHIFPELKESEGERIRKYLKRVFGEWSYDDLFEKGFKKEDIMAWLEKQGEQKPADKVEPKFKVGDWVAYNYNPNLPPKKIIQITNKHYVFDDCSFEIKTLEIDWHLWTIQDAKDGDVLATSAGAFICNGNNGGGSCPGSYCGIDNLGEFKTGVEHHWTGKKVYPATIEQRNLLFQKIHEAGYMWDSESKQLLSLKAEPIGKQKPAEWSEEDEERYLSCLKRLGTGNIEQPETVNTVWLKSLKDRIQPQQEWSEEDKNALKVVTDVFGQYGVHLLNYPAFVHWLKILPERISYNSSWKPSDEQLDSLYDVLNPCDGFDREVLESLYVQLKKLREE